MENGDILKFVLSGSLGGAIVSLMGPLLSEWLNGRNLQKALIAEIVAILDLADYRDYTAAMERIRTSLKEGKSVSPFRFNFDRETIIPVYLKNLDKLGMVKDPGSIVSFYAKLNALLQDIDTMNKTAPSIVEATPGVIQMHEAMYYLLVDMLATGERAVLVHTRSARHKKIRPEFANN